MIKKPANFAGFFVVIPKPPLLAVVIVLVNGVSIYLLTLIMVPDLHLNM